ncbi:MAG TPA: SMC family ATPase [Bacteroidota bacterium]|nr:SMC family ATPase [Bacteroidota bacterium]
MIITSVYLRNIKSFVESELRFSRGITIIAGRNGSGKSTVIEAVGLALFGAWPERFREGQARSGFIRNGERQARIAVDVECDGTRYTLLCDLECGRDGDKISFERRLLDADGGLLASSAGRIAAFQSDVRRYVLGEARIDDERLFRDIIGTEQGSFDKPFTSPEGERRKLFERILGIEDFQEFEKHFAQLIKWQTEETRQLAVREEERADAAPRLRDGETLFAEREALLSEATATYDQARDATAAARAEVEALSQRREALRDARARYEALRTRLEDAVRAEALAIAALREAEEAASILRNNEAGHTAFAQAETTLASLRIDAQRRDAIREQLHRATVDQQNAASTLRLAVERATTELEGARKEVEQVKSGLAEHEGRITSLREAYLQAHAHREQSERRAQVAAELRAFIHELASTKRALDNAGHSLQALRNSYNELTARLREIAEEADFLPALHSEATQLFARHPATEQATEELSELDRILKQAQDNERRAVETLTKARSEETSITTEGRTLNTELKKAQEKLAKLEGSILTLEQKQRDSARAVEKHDARWRDNERAFNEQLAAYATLDESITQNERLCSIHREAHELYLRHRQLGESAPQRAKDVEERRDEIRVMDAQLKDVVALVENLGRDVSEDAHTLAVQRHDAAVATEKQAAEEHGTRRALLDETREALVLLRRQHADYLDARRRHRRAFAEKALFGELHQKVVRELARRVGASIVQALSGFAAELYARLAPEQGLELRWSPENYAVELHGSQGAVRGRELSGGQLMGVSLAVKLALIRWYSRCRIGFLDEPTTHLDRETRAHLADVIQHLEQLTGDEAPWFDQLFVISHEESFEGIGHRIELHRDPLHGSRINDGE